MYRDWNDTSADGDTVNLGPYFEFFCFDAQFLRKSKDSTQTKSIINLLSEEPQKVYSMVTLSRAV